LVINCLFLLNFDNIDAEMTRSRDTHAGRLSLYADRSNAVHQQYLSDPEMLRQYELFLAWQLDYMLPFFSEFEEHPETAAAVQFVVSDLMGTGISARDSDIARVIPVMTRLLPDKAMQALASAMELNARTLEINFDVCTRLSKTVDIADGISEREYCDAFRRATTIEECLELIELTADLGKTLQRLVNIPLLGMTLRAMHRPAHAAGFGALQDFLEKGFTTFRGVEDVDCFLDRLSERLTDFYTRLCTEPLPDLDMKRRNPRRER
jgi:hypothetical protein